MSIRQFGECVSQMANLQCKLCLKAAEGGFKLIQRWKVDDFPVAMRFSQWHAKLSDQVVKLVNGRGYCTLDTLVP